MKSSLILEQISDAYDLALDYVEHEVGCMDFQNNWKVWVARGDAGTRIATWLKFIGRTDVEAADVVSILNELANSRTTWLSVFTRAGTRKASNLPQV